MKKKPRQKTGPLDAFGRTPLKAVIARLEAMELREAATREEIRRASMSVSSARETVQIVGELKTSLQVVYEAIANFDALIRPVAKKLFHEAQAARYGKGKH